MNTLETLEFMANLYEKTKSCTVTVNNAEVVGMCAVLFNLTESKRITRDSCRIISSYIIKDMKKGSIYLFPLTLEGARERASWCRNLLRELS